MKYRVFISSVQAEFSDIRLKLYELFEQDTLLRHYFTPYLFERDRVKGKSPQEVYLDEVDRSQIYLMLCGQEYGYEDKDGVSPTEHEYDRAKEQSLERWIFLKKVTKSNVLYNQCRAASLQAPEISTDEGFTITLYRPAVDPASTPQVPRKHPPSKDLSLIHISEPTRPY